MDYEYTDDFSLNKINASNNFKERKTYFEKHLKRYLKEFNSEHNYTYKLISLQAHIRLIISHYLMCCKKSLPMFFLLLNGFRSGLSVMIKSSHYTIVKNLIKNNFANEDIDKINKIIQSITIDYWNLPNMDNNIFLPDNYRELFQNWSTIKSDTAKLLDSKIGICLCGSDIYLHDIKMEVKNSKMCKKCLNEFIMDSEESNFTNLFKNLAIKN